MPYIAGLVVAGILVLVIKYFLDLSRKQEITVGTVIVAFILGAVAFNTYSAAQREKVLEVVKKFEQNKTIVCGTQEVNATNYDLSTGTYTFIGRENTPFYGEMISVSSCE